MTAIQTDRWGSEQCHRTVKIHTRNDPFMNIASHQSQGSRRENGRMIAWKDMIHHVVQPIHWGLDGINHPYWKIFHEEVKVTKQEVSFVDWK